MIKLKSLLCEWEGESWRSCRQWASHRDKFTGDSIPYIGIDFSVTQFELLYIGPGTGISLAHAKGGSGDTLHQLFNVLICEMNPRLASSNMKPDLQGIQTSCKRDGSNYELIIRVPLEESDRAWQINHRGGWGHDPGVGAVKSVSPNTPELETYTEITTIPSNGKITTHFATYPLQ